MSWWKVKNKNYRDTPAAVTPDGALIEALISAGVAPAEARRIADALKAQYVYRSEVSSLVGRLQDAGALTPKNEADRAARARAEAARQAADDAGQVPVAINVDGRAFFQNNVLVGGDLEAERLNIAREAAIAGALEARRAVFRELEILNAFNAQRGAFNVNAPLVLNGPLVARQGGRFAADVTFDGQVNLAGEVTWNNRVCQPASVLLTCAIAPDGSDKITIGSREVMVLKDHGDESSEQIQWSYEADPATVITGVGTQGVSVITSVGFDAENCAVTASGTTVYSVVSITSGSVAGLTGSVKITSVT